MNLSNAIKLFCEIELNRRFLTVNSIFVEFIEIEHFSVEFIRSFQLLVKNGTF